MVHWSEWTLELNLALFCFLPCIGSIYKRHFHITRQLNVQAFEITCIIYCNFYLKLWLQFILQYWLNHRCMYLVRVLQVQTCLLHVIMRHHRWDAAIELSYLTWVHDVFHWSWFRWADPCPEVYGNNPLQKQNLRLCTLLLLLIIIYSQPFSLRFQVEYNI